MTQKNKPYGYCIKCGQFRQLQNHHYKGYDTDETALYCMSCDQKAHNKARREGRCNLTSKEVQKLSTASGCRIRIKRIYFDERITNNIYLHEHLQYNTFTGTVSWTSGFVARNGIKLPEYVEIIYCDKCVLYYKSICQNCGQFVTRGILDVIINDSNDKQIPYFSKGC